MAKPHRIKELEQAHGDLHAVIPALVNLYGQAEAGRILGVSGATISNWLRDNGYEMHIIYERKQELQERAS